MSGIATSTSIDVTLPEWLNKCLRESSPRSVEPEDRRQNDASLICRAFSFAYQLHHGQFRKSGEPYIYHPVAVAGLLRDLGGSPAMIAAGFLHDVVEDTDVTIEEIEELFGSEVRRLVEGVTKLSKINFKSKTESQAENFRRMFLSMAQDIRVIVVKLADRLHNMRTLQYMSEDSRRRSAQETRDIFAPLANRLGIWHIKWELEDLAFKYLEPEAFRQMQQHVSEKRTAREEKLAKATDILRERLQQAGIRCLDISGRPKHLYSIYQKMQRQQKEFHEIYDLAALRIIVETNEECYRALAVVHDAFRPIPGRFKDYIGLPKPNRYQSLHTGVIGLTGRPLEIQIRTLEMHHIAEYGIAAHWKYKETGGSNSPLTAADEKFTWLRQLLEWQSDLKDAQEYLDSVKDNLFEDDVYVFTPKGDVVSLNPGSTSIDFAYRIHTEVGNHCSGARVNGRIVPLSTRLQNGDIVEILTQKNGHPSLDWLNFVRTSTAKYRIKQWYKRSRREENVTRGRDLLEKELGKTGFDNLLKSDAMQTVAEKCNYHSVEDLLAGLGYGEITLNLVLNRWRDVVKAQQPATMVIPPFVPKESSAKALRDVPHSSSRASDSPILGVEGLVYHLAGCCTPIPGESIIGVVTRGRGISIHRQGCHNLDSVEGDRLVPVKWNLAVENSSRPHTYPVNIQIEALDRVGVLKDILSRLSDQGINVRHAQVKTASGQPALMDLGIDIRDRSQLEQVFVQIKKMSDIINIRRVGQAEE
ncbi:bifunctional (p)ppGpp synthetase/guanosine-3',5'-bis(diphosphate) 3'-pyrophosphohydrolase [Nostoc sp. FACHB-87]|uniref:RelA/SpoT family protein n=1 Tax=Nostocales TaxID=1161 RepID=UPI0016845EAB|nr:MULTISPECIES: bifunctional (p)ppGpp synthetase/guanosine-3',5'-bis(diphosphate) 3'-pyrophosphohydrolase [Nostocales]MBD2300654.1 bifunctional (p)ppGpp synthetase/guanosine-3',5'-bis(diphosphate) 3'-pyrophosphohydrolase [Nostoc sp. FACHB-190]MBD2453552.1 bifunctional (p)ppGpp synthetase/guanosine-3',5'-bis(diphosphate) 3'-pyrophosphohydrolase [Nostoc sp. FACHB-87]MBD2475677.1 bifunctional (p)ppGpp synthetase/guanosine-3',5'-bis(diphosphate) 3'-pyrophosphohydrolase [Anabaena sp. FACHB-83]MBD24